MKQIKSKWRLPPELVARCLKFALLSHTAFDRQHYRELVLALVSKDVSRMAKEVDGGFAAIIVGSWQKPTAFSHYCKDKSAASKITELALQPTLCREFDAEDREAYEEDDESWIEENALSTFYEAYALMLGDLADIFTAVGTKILTLHLLIPGDASRGKIEAYESILHNIFENDMSFAGESEFDFATPDIKLIGDTCNLLRSVQRLFIYHSTAKSDTRLPSVKVKLQAVHAFVTFCPQLRSFELSGALVASSDGRSGAAHTVVNQNLKSAELEHIWMLRDFPQEVMLDIAVTSKPVYWDDKRFPTSWARNCRSVSMRNGLLLGKACADKNLPPSYPEASMEDQESHSNVAAIASKSTTVSSEADLSAWLSLFPNLQALHLGEIKKTAKSALDVAAVVTSMPSSVKTLSINPFEKQSYKGYIEELAAKKGIAFHWSTPGLWRVEDLGE